MTSEALRKVLGVGGHVRAEGWKGLDIRHEGDSGLGVIPIKDDILPDGAIDGGTLI
jgi:hypothetical protein